MNSAPSSIGVGKEGIRRVKMRPPMRSRASKTITLRPPSESARAAESPATPAPMTITSVDITYPIYSEMQGLCHAALHQNETGFQHLERTGHSGEDIKFIA